MEHPRRGCRRSSIPAAGLQGGLSPWSNPDRLPPTPAEVFGEIGAILLATLLFVALIHLGLWAAGIPPLA